LVTSYSTYKPGKEYFGFACNLLDEVEKITQNTNSFMGWITDKLALHQNKVHINNA
jgi:hypothetical protein